MYTVAGNEERLTGKHEVMSSSLPALSRALLYTISYCTSWVASFPISDSLRCPYVVAFLREVGMHVF